MKRVPNNLRRMGAIAVVAAAAAALLSAGMALAQQQGKIKVGLMLPYTGTFAALGTAITNGFKLAIAENGGKLAGRDIEYYTVDDESDPAKAPENANKLIKRDQVDVLVGTVHSGVALAMSKVARDNNTLLIIPNAGADEITGPLCAANVFRSSFSNSQFGIAMGKVMAEQTKKTAVTMTWKYAAGDESVGGFKEAFEAGGGKVIKELYAAVSASRVPVVPDRDCRPQARRRLRVLRRWRRGEVREGLRGGRPQQDDPSGRPRVPHRRHARRAGRCRTGAPDHAALRRWAQHSEEQRVSRRLHEGVFRRRRTSMPCRVTTPRSS